MHVKINELTKKIHGRTILHNINADFESGKIYGLAGPNGSGKTMLLRAMCGFIRPTSGSIIMDGKPVIFNQKLPVATGLIIENPGFMPYKNGIENLEYLAGINNDYDSVETERLLEEFGLLPHAQEKVKSYSLGMKQKLAITQALMEHQSLILLDEPTNGLDEDSVEVFLKEMERQKDMGRLIIIASHHRGELERVVDVFYQMREGELSLQE